MAAQIGRALDPGRALYIEADYFGGTGGQGAALFEDGALVWSASESTDDVAAPRSWLARTLKPTAPPARSAISRGLAALGVMPLVGRDEFDGLGLSRFRSLDDLGLGDED